MKKTKAKSNKSPAPATSNPSASAAKTGLTATPFASSKTGLTAKPFAPSKTTPPIPVKPVAGKRLKTTITALIDIGFGNLLYIRGEGAGLSWDKGTALDCVSDDKWSIDLGESSRPVAFKFLINDTTWSVGEDYTVAPGTSISVTPLF